MDRPSSRITGIVSFAMLLLAVPEAARAGLPVDLQPPTFDEIRCSPAHRRENPCACDPTNTDRTGTCRDERLAERRFVRIDPPVAIDATRGKLKSVTGTDFELTVLDPATASRIYQEYANDPKYKRHFEKTEKSVCAALAHDMSVDMQNNKRVISGKVFVEGHLLVDKKMGVASWGFHVAPIVLVRDDKGALAVYVIDPAILDRPATVQEWLAKLVDPSKSALNSAYFTPRFNYLPQSYEGHQGTMTSYTAEDLEGARELLRGDLRR